MKPAPFGYHRAASVDDAVRLLTGYDGTARVLAGGQSLVPMLNMRLARPDALVDLNPVAALGGIEAGPDEVRLGALVRYAAIESSARLAELVPLLGLAVRHVGDRQVRNRGTMGGSLSQADPTGEMPLACLTLGASVVVQGESGTREIALADLFETSYATTLEPCEVLTEVRIPAAPPHAAFVEACRRHNDFAVISCAAVGRRDPSGRWSDVRVGLGGVADTPVLATGAMELLEGSSLDGAAIDAAAQAALDVADPPSDIRASAEYRRHLVPVYVRRALHDLAGAA